MRYQLTKAMTNQSKRYGLADSENTQATDRGLKELTAPDKQVQRVMVLGGSSGPLIVVMDQRLCKPKSCISKIQPNIFDTNLLNLCYVKSYLFLIDWFGLLNPQS